jgi:hypothetical protein
MRSFLVALQRMLTLMGTVCMISLMNALTMQTRFLPPRVAAIGQSWILTQMVRRIVLINAPWTLIKSNLAIAAALPVMQIQMRTRRQTVMTNAAHILTGCLQALMCLLAQNLSPLQVGSIGSAGVHLCMHAA